MRRGTTAALAVAALASGCGSAGEPDVTPTPAAREAGTAAHFAVEPIASGLDRPVWVGSAPGDDEALWVAEQAGRLARVHAGRRRTVLDIRAQVKTGSEQGLLGVAFHPDFATTRRFYVHFSDRSGDTRVQELELRRGAPRLRRTLLALDQPEENHNGGQLAFGPDGHLYLGLGDGGGAFDPEQIAQDPENLLGKLIALDVAAPGRPHWSVVLTGLRNPWRFSFDFALGEVWIGDVGQDDIEEVNRVLLERDETPKNLGWSAFEGTERVEGRELREDGAVVWPVATYTHEQGCSVTGGVVYRGTRVPRLAGRYVYGDFCSGTLWSLKAKPGEGATDVRRERAKVSQLTHIGTDARGELVFASAGGQLLRAVRP